MVFGWSKAKAAGDAAKVEAAKAGADFSGVQRPHEILVHQIRERLLVLQGEAELQDERFKKEIRVIASLLSKLEAYLKV